MKWVQALRRLKAMLRHFHAQVFFYFSVPFLLSGFLAIGIIGVIHNNWAVWCGSLT